MIEPNNTEVICPNCTHQFRAIPVQVQQLLLAHGVEPPFLESSAQADVLDATLRKVERVLTEFSACYCAEVTDAQGTIWLGDLTREVRAAMRKEG